MRILEINTEKGWRGGENQTLLTILGLKELGHNVELLCLKNSELHKRAISKGIFCYTISKNNFLSLYYLIRDGYKFDIIHTQTSKQLTYCILTKFIHGSKVVFSRRVDFIPKGVFTILKYNLCDGIICVSNAISYILNEAGVNTNITVISDCVYEYQIKFEVGQKLILDLNIQNFKIIGTTAALVAHKDPFTLLNAIALLKEKRQDFVLLHFGVGDLEFEMLSLIKSYKLESFYKLIGFKEDVYQYFSIFDCFVMSSKEEGLGSSVLDAFIYKVPVVSTNAGGLKELLLNKGYVVEKQNPELLCQAINEALDNELENKKHIEAAYNYCSSELTVSKICELHISFFKTILYL